ncbi:MAG: type B 50S ribosomal protein L31 [Crocinitomicaceae bacterium]|jgi:large subunit ribosomal protein L31|nr:type B 50S ribosomal protein L31 [Crocinitomicaceae bacterium]MBK6952081.1 type B 50S ribosomal protein L31 [Crocinitomicaceae bacterium]MBK9591307.1 type B 50S ribosomal protein L31 [Crocinitomicaceae bacterium]
MKKGIHPEEYRTVVFKDMVSETGWVGRSAAVSKENITWEDGNEYPLIKLDVSSLSHPFFTGKQQYVDTAGRIDKFKTRYSSSMKKK